MHHAAGGVDLRDQQLQCIEGPRIGVGVGDVAGFLLVDVEPVTVSHHVEPGEAVLDHEGPDVRVDHRALAEEVLRIGVHDVLRNEHLVAAHAAPTVAHTGDEALDVRIGVGSDRHGSGVAVQLGVGAGRRERPGSLGGPGEAELPGRPPGVEHLRAVRLARRPVHEGGGRQQVVRVP